MILDFFGPLTLFPLCHSPLGAQEDEAPGVLEHDGKSGSNGKSDGGSDGNGKSHGKSHGKSDGKSGHNKTSWTGSP